jgi:hypothetical protein
MAHSERNNINKFNYIVDSGIDARHAGQDKNYHAFQGQYAQEHADIATGNYGGKKGTPYDTPDFYNPYAKKNQSSQSNQQNQPQNNASPARKNRIVGANGNWLQRDEKTGKWVDTGEKA